MLQDATEEWKPIVGFEGIYEVSNLGRVKRIKRSMGAICGKCLRTWCQQGSYPVVSLYRNGVRSQHLVHVLVAAAFLGPRPPGMEVNHLDGVKEHPHLTNLEYTTRSLNGEHAYRFGLNRKKLAPSQIKTIRDLASSRSTAELAKRFGVSEVTIMLIKRRVRWNHVA